MILALAGGVGGAKLAAGLAMCSPPSNLLVAVNTGDDFTPLGLRISPDLDTVMYPALKSRIEDLGLSVLATDAVMKNPTSGSWRERRLNSLQLCRKKFD